MNRSIVSLLFLAMLFSGVFQTYARGFFSKNTTGAHTEERETAPPATTLLFSLGGNISRYLFEDGGWQFGYRVGFIHNFSLSKKFGISVPLTYTRINASPENVAGRYYSVDDYYIYKLLSNWKISVGFLEIPILAVYKFHDNGKYDISSLVGPGIVIAMKDFSRIRSATVTNEIIGIFKDLPIEPQETHFTLPNSGLNLNAGLRVHHKRFYLDILYVLYPYTIKEINKLNSISIVLGFDLG